MNVIAESTVQLKRLNWTGTKGNYANYAYYAGTEAGNPSGNTDNLKQIDYYDGNDVLVLSVQYLYDLLDRVIQEKSL